MSNKKIRSVLSAVLAGVILLSSAVLSACNPKNPVDQNPVEKIYTYNEYISASPTTWNSHIGTSDADSYVQMYTEIGLYAITLNDSRTNYAFSDEMAKGDPVDVTADYIGKYGIAEGDTGKAYLINLNPDAKWANGTKITSEDYVWSMGQLLDPNMKNSKASQFYTGTGEVYNAGNYYMSSNAPDYNKIPKADIYTDAEIESLVQKGQLFFSVNTPIADSEGSFTIAGYHDLALSKAETGSTTILSLFYKDKDMVNNSDVYEVLSALQTNDAGYVLITAENLPVIKEALISFTGNAPSAFGAWYNLCTVAKSTVTEYNKITKGTEYDDAQIQALIVNGQLYFSVNNPITDSEGSYTVASYHEFAVKRAEAGNTAILSLFYKDKDMVNNTDVYEVLSALGVNSDGYVKVTEDNFSVIKEALSAFTGNAPSTFGAWYNLCSIKTEREVEPTTFDDVGIFAVDDNSFVIVFANSISLWDAKYQLTTNWIVYKPFYEAGKSQIGSLTTTSYGTSVDNYMAYGPYVLASYQKDKELVFERNTNWYGYSAEATNYHAGQYQTDRIVTQIIEQQSTALLEFEKGNLDQVKLVTSDLDKYKFSDYLLKRTASNIWQIAFNSDVTALEKIEGDGAGNRRILSVLEFRKALSLCLNRTVIGSEIAAGSAPAFSYINDNYYYDMKNDPDSVYRNSEAGMKAIVDLYGIEYGEGKRYATLEAAYASVTGYDIDQAKLCFQSAYETAVSQNIYKNGDKIQITIYTNDLTAVRSAIAQYMQTQVNAATQGTALEGKITITFKEQSSGRNEDLNQGKIEASFYSVSGDYDDPYGMLGSYTDKSQTTLLEYGFDPATETFDITYDFDGDGTAETVTKTYAAWQKSVVAGGEYVNASADIKLLILSTLENKLLGGFRTLPLYVGTDVLLYSKKVNYATTDADIFAAYGGIRLLTYNYSDAEWESYCKENTLNYAE